MISSFAVVAMLQAVFNHVISGMCVHGRGVGVGVPVLLRGVPIFLIVVVWPPFTTFLSFSFGCLVCCPTTCRLTDDEGTVIDDLSSLDFEATYALIESFGKPTPVDNAGRSHAHSSPVEAPSNLGKRAVKLLMAHEHRH